MAKFPWRFRFKTKAQECAFWIGVGMATLRCEAATSPAIRMDSMLGYTFPNTAAPAVSSMTVKRSAQILGAIVPLKTGFPSNNVPAREQFLTRKGVDNRKGACQYYKAIGAVARCDGKGKLLGGITFDDWKHATHMAPYTLNNQKEVTASFINRTDLNLARNHHSISYGPNNTAAYVCNGLGPNFDAVDGDASVTQAVANAVSGRNQIACVAMDYKSMPNVNGGKAFVRFLIFGPDGNLLPSINLDGRAEKFMPGVCVACHGGTHYAGYYPEDGSGLPDIGSHFLPYDAGNFLFSSVPGLRRPEQEAAIKQLNLIVLKGAGPTKAETDLINGWYAPNLSAATLNQHYVPAGWSAQGDTVVTDTYHKIIAPMCRTCHAAMPERYNFDDRYDTVIPRDNDNLVKTSRMCRDDGFRRADRNFSMANSLVTFDRFWTTAGLPELFAQYLFVENQVGSGFVCGAP